MFWRDRRVFVTGATGFIGGWVIKDLLAAGAQIAVLVPDIDPQAELYRSGDVQRVTVINGRLEDLSTIERAINGYAVQTVIHLAAQAIVSTAQRSPLSTFEANIRGTYHVLEACRLHRDLVSEVVIASSDKAYGMQPVLPYTEDMPLQGRNPYEVSKSCADLLAQSYAHTYDLPVVIARCGNVYGGGDLNWSRIIPGAIRAIWKGERPIIRSDGTYLRDYIYVKDIARAYLRVAEMLHAGNVAGQAFNFSTDQPVAVTALVNEVSRLMGRTDLEPQVLNCAQGEIRDQNLSSRKAQQMLDWAPSYDLDSGLRETIAWYEGFLAR
jgi:CDP-glucose 4,6-dehydratase